MASSDYNKTNGTRYANNYDHQLLFVRLILYVILAIQDLLTNPNPDSPAQREAFEIFTTNPVEYRKRIREQTRRNLPQS